MTYAYSTSTRIPTYFIRLWGKSFASMNTTPNGSSFLGGRFPSSQPTVKDGGARLATGHLQTWWEMIPKYFSTLLVKNSLQEISHDNFPSLRM